MTTSDEDGAVNSSREKAYDTAVNTRAFEIGLFWQRALFFWGFIGAAFVGHAALRDAGSDLSLVLACFGLVCSFGWSLANRGSKFWQESWELKVEAAEKNVTGPLFARPENPPNKGFWLSGRRFSVSKISIALADYMVLVWLGLLAWETFRLVCPESVTPGLKSWLGIAAVILTVGFCGLMALKGRSSPQALGTET